MKKATLLTVFFLLIISNIVQAQSSQQKSNNFSKKAFEYLNKFDFNNTIIFSEKALKLNPNNCNAYYAIGSVKYYQQDYKGALIDLKKTISLKCGNDDVYTRMADCYLKLDEITECFKFYQMAIDFAKGESLGFVYYQRAQSRVELLDWSGALKDINLALKFIVVNNSLLFILRGEINLKLGNYNNSLNDLNKAIELSPGELWSAYYKRGMVRLKLNDKINACEDFELAYKIDSNTITYNGVNDNCRKLNKF